MANFSKYMVTGFFGLGLAIIASRLVTPSPNPANSEIIVPAFSSVALAGQEVFETNCATCHGKNAAGSDKGPPLVHDIYNPGHHGDEAFLFAAKRGVRRHHWTFGNMPPQQQVSAEQISRLVRYVRELQEANGIFFRPHQM